MSVTLQFIKLIAVLAYVFAPTFFIMEYVVLRYYPNVDGMMALTVCLLILAFFAATLVDFASWLERKRQGGA